MATAPDDGRGSQGSRPFVVWWARTRGSVVASVVALAACRGGSTAPLPEPASLVLSPATSSLSYLGATQDLVATVFAEDGSTISGVTVSWSTSSASVATVSDQGRVTAVGNGTAEIFASAGVADASASVTVQQLPANLTLSPDTLRLSVVGETARLTAVVEDAGGSEVGDASIAFESADATIASVDGTGLVTARGNGTTFVTAEAAPGGASLTESVRVEVGSYLPPAYLVGGYVGATYSDLIGPAVGGGTFTYAVTAGALPGGLSLNATTAEVEGTATTPGVHFFQVSAANGVVTVSERFAITISTKAIGAFNLWVTYNGGALPPTNARTALSAAVARWEQLITGDPGPAVTYPPSGLDPDDCSLVDASLLNGAFVEDVAILVALDAIDGVGKTLARGGPCGYGRAAIPAVITGQLMVDEADAAAASTTRLEDIVVHEMAHVLGVGTLWQDSTIGVGTATPLYVGQHANDEWLALGGASDGVPLEPDIGAHWHESWFDAELMTPFAEASTVSMPLSRLTVGAVLDLGWAAALTAADPFTLPACAGACTVPAPTSGEAAAASVPDFVIERLRPLP